MHIPKKVLPAVMIMLWSFQAFGITGNGDSLSYEILLNSKLLNDLKIRQDLTGNIDLTANHLILLSSADQFYLLGWGGMVPFGKPVKGEISSFAFTHDSTLMTIREDELCYFDPEGRLSLLYKLPDKGMGISPGTHLMYIYDRNRKKEKKAVYAIAQGARYTKLLDMPSAINAVIETRKALIIASGSSLFEFNLPEKRLTAITTMPEGREIESVAADTSAGRIYFSAGNKIYSLKDGRADLISDDLGGILRYHGNGLIVFNPQKKILTRIVGIERSIAENQKTNNGADTKKPSGPLTNSGITEMVRSGFPDQRIIDLIRCSKVDFDLGVDAMVDLSEKGVSSQVILEMKQAMKKPANPNQKK